MTKRHFASYSEARAHLRDVLDAAESGKVTTVARDRDRFAVMNANILRSHLAGLLQSEVVVTAEGGGWSAFIPGTSLSAEGSTFDDVIDDLVDAVREYATDWNDRLFTAPNHHSKWALVMLTELSTDDELKSWILHTDSSVTQ